MESREIQQKLRDNGFRSNDGRELVVDGDIGAKTREAVARFQVAYCGPGGWLDIDGNPGGRTQEALTFLPRLSTHFTVKEVACKHCGCPYVNRQLLSALEELRERLNRPIKLLSAYRCPAHNKHVGGAPSSMHMHGAACDLSTPISAEYVKSIRRFGGIGKRGSNASHVDVRHVMGDLNETLMASERNPVMWKY